MRKTERNVILVTSDIAMDRIECEVVGWGAGGDWVVVGQGVLEIPRRIAIATTGLGPLDHGPLPCQEMNPEYIPNSRLWLRRNKGRAAR